MPTSSRKSPFMTSDIRLEKLTKLGIALMQEEKDRALRGDLDGLADVNDRKTEFLKQMDDIKQSIEKSGPLELRRARKEEIQALFDIIRRRAEENQYLIRAATAGVKSAKRQMLSLQEASAALGVYDQDGEPMRIRSENQATTGGVF